MTKMAKTIFFVILAKYYRATGKLVNLYSTDNKQQENG